MEIDGTNHLPQSSDSFLSSPPPAAGISLLEIDFSDLFLTRYHPREIILSDIFNPRFRHLRQTADN
jgi:hypothetical protein